MRAVCQVQKMAVDCTGRSMRPKHPVVASLLRARCGALRLALPVYGHLHSRFARPPVVTAFLRGLNARACGLGGGLPNSLSRAYTQAQY